jgi:stearoyl-CoA desaturase (Delta-9 desaturase)
MSETCVTTPRPGVSPVQVTRLERNANIAAVALPFLGVLAGGALLWDHFLTPLDLAIMGAMYLGTAIGITVGFHRLLTHRAFQTHTWLRYTLALLGSMAVQGPVIDWVADHRKHHTFTDEEGDPHSPHAGQGAGLTGMVRGLWHAHAGWLFSTHGQASSKRFAQDLLADPGMRRINRGFPLIALASLAIPFALGASVTAALGHGPGACLAAGAAALLWGGLVRIFLVHHITWSINSICHFFGSRRFAVEDHSTNVFWLALPSLGEAWHHNHHAFPRSAFHGLRWWELDPSGWLILGMARVKLAWDVVRVSTDKQREKLASATSSEPAASAPGA